MTEIPRWQWKHGKSVYEGDQSTLLSWWENAGFVKYWNARVQPVTESGCFIWVASLVSTGYARVCWNYSFAYGHRIAYIKEFGSIPNETLDHVCKVKCCVNPYHLEPVTRRENTIRRGRTKGRTGLCRT